MIFLRCQTISEKGRYYEGQVIKRFHRILTQAIGGAPKGSIVLDVGGNIGFYT